MKKDLPFYFIVISIFLLMISPFLFTRGMFMDGIIYAVLSKNFAVGEGSFLYPVFSETFLLNFQSHPPMFFFLQGMIFKIFGTSFLVERLFSVLCIVLTGIITIKTYKRLDLKSGFLPLLFLVLIPLITWSATNNMIENALIIFTSFSVLFYLYSLKNKRLVFLFLAGISIAIGFSIKGFVAFFPLSFPFVYWLVIRDTAFKRMFFDTMLILIISIAPIIIPIYSSPEVMDYFNHYFKTQIMGSIENAVTVNSRFYIVWRFLRELLIPIIIIGLFEIILRLKWKITIFKNKENNKKALMMFLFSLTAVLPVMVSMKQSGFYILTAFPFAAIALSALIDEYIYELSSKLNLKSKGFSIFKYVSICLLVVSISFGFLFIGKDGRDVKLLSDMDVIAKKLPQKSIISVTNQMREEYSLFAYYARFHDISMDLNPDNQRQYLLIRKEYSYSFEEMNYKKVDLETQSFDLYEKEN